MQTVCMQDVDFANLLGEIELKCVEATLTHARGHSTGAAESLDEEGTRDQVEVSRDGSGVSNF